MKESEIRPKELHEKYLELSAADASYFFNSASLDYINCISCNSSNYQLAFEKNKFQFMICLECKTLFQSPRPHQEAFHKFYENSISGEYWAEVFYPSVAEARREKIFRRRVDKLTKFLDTKNITPGNILDVGCGYGIFLEEFSKKHKKCNLLGIEPSIALAKKSRDIGICVTEDIVENCGHLNNSIDLLTCFEVYEHVYDPSRFLRALYDLLKPNGYLLLTTLCVDGFDISILGQHSKSIAPPHHLNFSSISGFHKIFMMAGFKELEIMTPGELDVDIVRNAINDNPSINQTMPDFVNRILSDETLSINFQKFLQNNQLSSHLWIYAKK